MSHYDDILYQERSALLQTEKEHLLFSMLKPAIFIDGDQWCVLYGKNLQDGVAGFGDTPYSAMLNFGDNWYKPIAQQDKRELLPEVCPVTVENLILDYVKDPERAGDLYEYIRYYFNNQY